MLKKVSRCIALDNYCYPFACLQSDNLDVNCGRNQDNNITKSAQAINAGRQQPPPPPRGAPPASAAMPSGWIATTSESGHTYYYNEETGETQWERPTV